MLAPIKMITVSQDLLQAYAQASGDHNPIHLNNDAAIKAGLPGVIAHGMFIASFLVKRIEDALSLSELGDEFGKPNGLSLLHFQMRFRNMVFLGDEISVSGKIKSQDQTKVVFEMEARNQKSELTTTGTIEYQIAPN